MNSGEETNLHPGQGLAGRHPSHAASLPQALAKAGEALIQAQNEDGHWRWELEADCTIPAEYILMMHFTDEVDEALQAKLATYIRRRQCPEHGGWPLYSGGHFDVSCSVKAYYALKLVGDDADSPHMARVREAILANGGAAKANVFTRILLAQYNQIPWRAIPVVPAEIVRFPDWFFFSLNKVAYWSRTVMVPLSVLYSLRSKARNPTGTGVRELFTVAPEKERDYFPIWSWRSRIFFWFERIVARLEPLLPRSFRMESVRRASRWYIERLNGEDGLGAIFPAMVYAYEGLIELGYSPDHPYRVQAGRALRHLVAEHGDEAYPEPCVSPVWDTALAARTLQETGREDAFTAAQRGLDWLATRQIRETEGDWKDGNPDLAPGGWPFQYGNAFYPDLDDTAAVANSLHAMDHDGRYQEAVARALQWVRGMQSRNGGFGAFDRDNTYHYLNDIPFADHGALLDPPTSDVTARCVAFLGKAGGPESRPALERAVAFLKDAQEPSGPWFGRWGTNYIYGTWSVLEGLAQADWDMREGWIQKAVAWLKGVQQPDGGWGEGNGTYFQPEKAGQGAASTPFQTAWAVLALLAAGEGEIPEIRKGVDFLLRNQTADGLWTDPQFTAPGFPRVFHLKYRGYNNYFPLQALAHYRRHRQGLGAW
ncbi:squalene--hopene cyclase [Thiohalorhabdus sp.]|uniref:squalene--hopene cyclase n=1 Tax=Thiohalorhabdus sp. TaxID=3094134 RepID=UPI002FC3B99A